MEDLGRKLWTRASQLEDEGRTEAAIEAYIEAAKAGSVESLINLALIYEDKLDPTLLKEAIGLYEKAVNLGSSIAAWNLYKHYHSSGSLEDSSKWLRIAAEMGDEDAIILLQGD